MSVYALAAVKNVVASEFVMLKSTPTEAGDPPRRRTPVVVLREAERSPAVREANCVAAPAPTYPRALTFPAVVTWRATLTLFVRTRKPFVDPVGRLTIPPAVAPLSAP